MRFAGPVSVAILVIVQLGASARAQGATKDSRNLLLDKLFSWYSSAPDPSFR